LSGINLHFGQIGSRVERGNLWLLEVKELKAERIETEKIRRLEGEKLRRLVRPTNGG
jgi:ribosomal protein L20A (L18A)